jgi:hypothetical protein
MLLSLFRKAALPCLLLILLQSSAQAQEWETVGFRSSWPRLRFRQSFTFKVRETSDWPTVLGTFSTVSSFGCSGGTLGFNGMTYAGGSSPFCPTCPPGFSVGNQGYLPAIAGTMASQGGFAFNGQVLAATSPAAPQYVPAAGVQAVSTAASQGPVLQPMPAGPAMPSAVYQSIQKTQQVLQGLQPDAPPALSPATSPGTDEVAAQLLALTKAVEALATVAARHEAQIKKLSAGKEPGS